MGNKVIRIGTSSTSSEQANGETYRDLNMTSKQVLKEGKVRYEIDKSIDANAVFNSLRNIFTWIPGERVINPEFGTQLRKMLYEGITAQTEEMVVAEIRMSVQKWDPRVSITDIINISTTEDTEDNTIRLDIKFKIAGLDEVYTYEYKQQISE